MRAQIASPLDIHVACANGLPLWMGISASTDEGVVLLDIFVVVGVLDADFADSPQPTAAIAAATTVTIAIRTRSMMFPSLGGCNVTLHTLAAGIAVDADAMSSTDFLNT